MRGTIQRKTDDVDPIHQQRIHSKNKGNKKRKKPTLYNIGR